MKKEKVSMWSEIDLEMFKSIIYSFWNNETWTRNKVIELQYLLGIKSSPMVRIYLGMDLRYDGWKNGIKEHIESLANMAGDELVNFVYEEPNTFFKANLNCSDKSAHIFPLSPSKSKLPGGISNIAGVSSVNEMFDFLFNTFWKDFIDPNSAGLVPWFTKNEDNYRAYIGNPIGDTRTVSDKDKTFRIRIIDLDTWKEMVEDVVNKGNDIADKYVSEDIKKENIDFEIEGDPMDIMKQLLNVFNNLKN